MGWEGATGARERRRMWTFWLMAGALALGSGIALLMGFRRGAGAAAEVPASALDVQLYRDQLAGIERDAARGTIAAEEAGRLRTEISRRLLEADRQSRAAGTTRLAEGPRLGLPVVVLALAGAGALYWSLGAPGYPDMPMAARLAMSEKLQENRPSQAVAEADAPAPVQPQGADAEYLSLMEKLRSTVAERPDDIRGQRLLAENEARLGDYRAAYAAQREVIRLAGDAATAEDYALLGEMLVYAAGGYVSPEAEAALTEALRRDPKNTAALYLSGLMFAQVDRADRTFALWRSALESAAPDSPWVKPLQEQIGDMAARAGVRYQPPGAAAGPMAGMMPGPGAGDVAAAAEMSAEDRQAMIEGMVERLNERLATEGGSADEWARLIGALGVLGQTDRARAIWTEAQGRFASMPEDLAKVRAAAVQAGVAE
ncbi:cytochrome c-type biogenesis protein CcmH [Gemmobacter caeni]|uniref:Cytochrome c-type biogenesis protein CcmH n=2 Tax=Gemmobacter caeni TaxID=589035 RepID=A0A2T6AP66_9RHOB|nr:cytochrome c-type biogenesis protein CcmH [Gemmobacter caeni]TWI93728.1 cytochrome c-type biogenesis protein CcmH [Gemmobacter caeni]